MKLFLHLSVCQCSLLCLLCIPLQLLYFEPWVSLVLSILLKCRVPPSPRSLSASLIWLPPWLWTPAQVFDRGLAVCSRLSAAACYKACVIFSAKCRLQTQGQLKVSQQRHPVPPGPRCTQEAGLLRVPLSGPGACPGLQTQALMQADS